MYFAAGEAFFVDVGIEAADQFVSMIRDGAADATVSVCGTNEAASAQPPTWT